MKFAHYSVVDLITWGDEAAYSVEIQQLTKWYLVNKLALNTTKTKEMILGFRTKLRPEQTPVLRRSTFSKSWAVSSLMT